MLPSRADLPVDGLVQGVDFSGWLDVAAPTPARFRFALAESAGTDQLSGLEVVAAHGADLKSAARHLYDDLAAAAFTGSAFLHRIANPDEPGMPAIERLILPFAGNGRRVDGLLICGVATPASHTVH